MTMITYINENKIVSELDVKSKYPGCKFILTKSFEREGVMFGELMAISADISDQNDLFKYGHSFDNLGLVFFGGDYHIDKLCNGRIKISKQNGEEK